MFNKYLTFFALAIVLITVGCSRPVVKPNLGPGAMGPGFPRPGTGAGMIQEREAGMLQAELRTIYFDFDNYSLSADAQSALQYNAEVLKRVPNAMIVAEGHADERGTPEYNLALGDRRARSAVDFLVTLGLPPNRFSIVSYGSELPVDPSHNEAAWAKNRRVYLRVSQ